MTQHFSLTAVAKLELSHTEGTSTSKHEGIGMFLEVSENLDRTKYLDEEDLPTEEGSRALTMVLTSALVANIHMADQSGWRDSAEHLRYIIGELERGFASVATVSKGKM